MCNSYKRGTTYCVSCQTYKPWAEFSEYKVYVCDECREKKKNTKTQQPKYGKHHKLEKHDRMKAPFNMSNKTKEMYLTFLRFKNEVLEGYEDIMSEEDFFLFIPKAFYIEELEELYGWKAKQIEKFYKDIHLDVVFKSSTLTRHADVSEVIHRELTYEEKRVFELARKKFSGSLLLKRAVKERDNYRCKHCGRGELGGITLHIHHLQTVRNHPELALNMDNLVCLCNECHNEFHSIYGHGRTRDLGIAEFQEWQDSVYC